jgi:osmotically-inducible protein OsmY
MQARRGPGDIRNFRQAHGIPAPASVAYNDAGTNPARSLFMRRLLSLIAVALFASSLLGCAGAGAKTGEYIDDSAITTKVKARLYDDPVTSGWDIKVSTDKGVVQLSGFVKSSKEKDRAGEIARKVEGVRSVANDLIVK